MSETAAINSEAPVPERVRLALEGARDFGDFKRRRSFRFLHLFSGPKDVVAKALKEIAEKEGIAVECISFDVLRDKDEDILKDEPYEKFICMAANDELDGAHGGFPCASFSRARWNEGHGPKPVRNLQFMYGLPENSASQQKECDRGTVMAIRTCNIVAETIQSQRKRKVAQVGTLENPPGSPEQSEGPAWALPELIEFMTKLEGKTALFNSCAYMKGNVRWFKPARWSGCLNGIESLSRRCTCPNYVIHESLVGKSKTAASAEYPMDLALAYSKLVIEEFKVTLQLEWLRFRLRVKSAEVSELQVKQAANKMKNHCKPEANLSSLRGSKRAWMFTPGYDEKAVEQVHLSKKQRKEMENDAYIGGMRNPQKALGKMGRMRDVGHDLARMWERFVKQYPKALLVAATYGSESCEVEKDILSEWKKWMAKMLKAKEFEDVILREAWEFDSPLDARLWEAWIRASGDPEEHLVSWIRSGAPLGMARPIEECNIFPKVWDEENHGEEVPELEAQMGVQNYKSVLEEPDHAKEELARYVEKGFCQIWSEEKVKATFQKGTVSKLALLLKAKDGGGIKRRFIIDLLRSGGNKLAKVGERIVLPRTQDVIQGIRYLWSQREKAIVMAKKEGWWISEDREHHRGEFMDDIELVTADLSDAYCHLGVHRDEVPHCLAPGLRQGEMVVFISMLFGFRAAPLIMGRLAACLARLISSMVPPWEMQLQVYMDDPLFCFMGPSARRAQHLAMILYTMAALGINLAWHKGKRGTVATWIGVQFEIRLAESVIYLTLPMKVIVELKGILEEWGTKGMVALRELRSTTGRLSWVAGILVRARWCTSILYAVVAAAMKEEAAAVENVKSKGKASLVHVKRFELARTWFLKMFENPNDLAIRREPILEAMPEYGLISDASPFGVGAILVEVNSATGELSPLAAMEATVEEADAAWLGVPWKEAASQGVLEGWAILLGIRMFGRLIKNKAILIKSDSTVALAMTAKLASKSPGLNWLGAELGLKAEQLNLGKFHLRHIAGMWNVEADWLSRPDNRGPVPTKLEGIKVKKFSREKKRISMLPSPGERPDLWGTKSDVISQAFECL